MSYGRAVELSLDSVSMPFLSTDMPRTAVLQEIGQQAAGGKLAQNFSPQILYAQNVLPTKYGYSSLVKSKLISETEGKLFKNSQQVVGPDNMKYTLALTSTGAAVSLAGSNSWTYQTTIPGITALTEFSTAHVDGQQYFMIAGLGAYKMNTGPLGFSSVTLTAITAANINCMCGASGYVLIADEDTVYWDSPGARLNFTPALGGAGSTKISYLRGRIIGMFPLANGFIVYSTGNAVSAQYSGNPNVPWIFREVQGSGGISFGYNVADAENLDFHLVWTSKGMQQVSAAKAENIMPEFTEFAQVGRRERLVLVSASIGVPLYLDGSWPLDGSFFLAGVEDSQGGRLFPGYRIEPTDYGLPFNVKPSIISNRYYGLSYGPVPANPAADYPVFLEAVIFDKDLSQWGKLVRPHVSLYGLGLEDGIKFATYANYASTDERYNDQIATPYNLATQNLGFTSGGLSQLTSVNLLGEMLNYTKVQLQDGAVVDPDLVPALLFGRLAIFKQRPTLIHQFEFNEFNLADLTAAVLFWSSNSNSAQATFAEPVQRLPYIDTDGWSPVIKLRKTSKQFGFGLLGNFELKTVIVRCQESGSR